MGRLGQSVAVILWVAFADASLAGLPDAKPAEVGLDAARLARIDDVVAQAIERKQFPGAVVLVGRNGKVAFAKAYGHRAVEPKLEPMTRDTIFDMASLTKPMATAASAMVLLERGKIRLGDSIDKYVPAMAGNGKNRITIEHLLRHRAGLVPDDPMADYAEGPEAAWKKLEAIGVVSPPGEKFVYSDVGFALLGRIVERVAGRPLDQFANDEIFGPMGMSDTGFRPAADRRGRIAPTEKLDGLMLRGVVHDPRARALGGVAGHAGLFSTADDLAVFAQMILDGGRAANGARIFGPLTVRAMIDAAETPAAQRRGLGWDVATNFSGPRGDLFGPTSFGHTGFTGTSLWIDPETRTFVILLTSRLHPDGKGNPGDTRARIATIAASAVLELAKKAPAHPVACGIDVLVQNGFRELQGKKVGLVTNHTGRTKSGESTIDVLAHAPGVKLVALFSPEHGIRGLVDAEVADAKDEKTGLPIHSLYGKTRRPTLESLKGVDVLVYDIQDVGARFYTYISTLGLVLEAAKEAGVAVMVLDRPNPIGGLATAGPVRDLEFASFIAYHALPVRHGMTVGELAAMFNVERAVGARLTVVPCQGWRRSDFYDATGLIWINPSPNMRNLNEAVLYPGVGLLEASNLATGRGTDTPFERVGAPWLDPARFADAMNDLELPGVRFVGIRFTPTERQYKGRECGGVQILVTDRARFEPVALGVGMAVVIREVAREHWEPDGFLKMLADRRAYQALLDGKTVPEIQAVWAKELDEFNRVRGKYLIYP